MFLSKIVLKKQRYYRFFGSIKIPCTWQSHAATNDIQHLYNDRNCFSTFPQLETKQGSVSPKIRDFLPRCILCSPLFLRKLVLLQSDLYGLLVSNLILWWSKWSVLSLKQFYNVNIFHKFYFERKRDANYTIDKFLSKFKV